jgi:hypothetical protein
MYTIALTLVPYEQGVNAGRGIITIEVAAGCTPLPWLVRHQYCVRTLHAVHDLCFPVCLSACAATQT